MIFAQADGEPTFDDYPEYEQFPDYAPGLFDHFWSFYYTVGILLKIWMVIECARKDPDRGMWIWIILLLPFGEVVYFFARWLPATNLKPPGFLRRWTKRRDLERLEIAARQIGNPHQFVEWGEALRELGRFEDAGRAYDRALEKDPENMPALWGSALVEMQRERYDVARDRLSLLLERDPQYKFGDVSLCYGKALHASGERDEARAHLEAHVRRWRHPEALFLLAGIHHRKHDVEETRRWLQELLMDINSSPPAIARRQIVWKRRARRLLKKLPRPTHTA